MRGIHNELDLLLILNYEQDMSIDRDVSRHEVCHE